MAAKALSDAAKKRVVDRLRDIQDRLADARDDHKRRVVLDNDTSTRHTIVTIEQQRLGYITALHDVLPTQTVHALVDDVAGVADGDNGAQDGAVATAAVSVEDDSADAID